MTGVCILRRISDYEIGRNKYRVVKIWLRPQVIRTHFLSLRIWLSFRGKNTRHLEDYKNLVVLALRKRSNYICGGNQCLELRFCIMLRTSLGSNSMDFTCEMLSASVFIVQMLSLTMGFLHHCIESTSSESQDQYRSTKEGYICVTFLEIRKIGKVLISWTLEAVNLS